MNTTTKRNDVHRRGAFVPSQYTFFAAYYSGPGGGKSVVTARGRVQDWTDCVRARRPMGG